MALTTDPGVYAGSDAQSQATGQNPTPRAHKPWNWLPPNFRYRKLSAQENRHQQVIEQQMTKLYEKEAELYRKQLEDPNSQASLVRAAAAARYAAHMKLKAEMAMAKQVPGNQPANESTQTVPAVNKRTEVQSVRARSPS